MKEIPWVNDDGLPLEEYWQKLGMRKFIQIRVYENPILRTSSLDDEHRNIVSSFCEEELGIGTIAGNNGTIYPANPNVKIPGMGRLHYSNRIYVMSDNSVVYGLGPDIGHILELNTKDPEVKFAIET